MTYRFRDIDDLESLLVNTTNAKTFRQAAELIGNCKFGVMAGDVVSQQEIGEICQSLHRVADRYLEAHNRMLDEAERTP